MRTLTRTLLAKNRARNVHKTAFRRVPSVFSALKIRCTLEFVKSVRLGRPIADLTSSAKIVKLGFIDPR